MILFCGFFTPLPLSHEVFRNFGIYYRFVGRKTHCVLGTILAGAKLCFAWEKS